MKTLRVTIKGMSPLSQGRYHDTPKLDRESHSDYEIRTWREKMHVNGDGFVLISSFALKNCLSEAAKFLSKKIPGSGKATFTKHFESGVIIADGIVLKVKKDDVPFLKLFVPSDGKRGGGSRVWKYFPVIQEWGGTFDILIVDEILTLDVLQEHLEMAGKFIGLGSLRVRNNRTFGRFEIIDAEFVGEEKEVRRLRRA